MFNFENPWFLTLIIIFLICDRWCKERSYAIFFPHVESLLIKNRNRLPWISVLKWIGIVSAVIAFASPVYTKQLKIDKKDARDIVLILDASESMGEPISSNFGQLESKFDAAKDAMKTFIRSRSSDRIGIVTFGDTAFNASPLTFDTNFLIQILDMQNIGVAGKRTAINDAIIQSYSMLSESQARSKIVILLTDGVENQSVIDKDELMDYISKSPITLYTIGFGNIGEFDPYYLKDLATSAKGEFFASSNKNMLNSIYAYINNKEITKVDAKPRVYKEYLYIYPLFLSFISLILWIYFRNTKGI